MITPILSHFLTVKKKNKIINAWAHGDPCDAPEAKGDVRHHKAVIDCQSRYVSSCVIILDNRALRTDCQRAQDPTTPGQVVFQMLQYPVNRALCTFAKLLRKHSKSFSGHHVLKGLLCVYTSFTALSLGDPPLYFSISIRILVVATDKLEILQHKMAFYVISDLSVQTHKAWLQFEKKKKDKIAFIGMLLQKNEWQVTSVQLRAVADQWGRTT